MNGQLASRERLRLLVVWPPYSCGTVLQLVSPCPILEVLPTNIESPESGVVFLIRKIRSIPWASFNALPVLEAIPESIRQAAY